MSEVERTVNIVVALDLDRYDEVLESVRKAGLIIRSKQPAIGTVVGSAPEISLPKLRAVDGVESVEPERVFQV
ncbi:hypothetical protein [Streptomyces sp. NBC_01481]|uniref:hypothetical protein n=1 Tax=Streptomyces sp. NBC_01481 TaxID=2975869 RepID=UPI00225B193D|nr:hypothetical protein [Streptomyces sp. NBC_01481]MCX4587712.1 hypothetical protein [Streptomyces sp. NBC_01481]